MACALLRAARRVRGVHVQVLGGGTPSTSVPEYWRDGDITWDSPSVGTLQLYFWLLENRPKIISLATGATFTEINKATFRQLPIVVAPDTIGSAFEDTAAPIAELVANLVHKNTNLRTTRDLLLPKLISGEIAIEAVERRLAVGRTLGERDG